MAQTASAQVAVVAREQVELVKREITTRAKQAGPGVAMVAGGAGLCALASATGTAGLVLLLSRRTGASAAAFTVTGAYAGAGALLARQGLGVLRDGATTNLPDVPVEEEEEAPQRPKPNSGNRKPAAKATRRAKPSAKSASKAAGSAKRATKSAGTRRRASTA